MPKQTGLDVLWTQRLFQQGFVLELDHADGQVIGRAPVGVQQMKLVICGCRDGRKMLIGGGRHGLLLENTWLKQLSWHPLLRVTNQSVFGK